MSQTKEISQIEIVKTEKADGETPQSYVQRLAWLGATETACKKALARQFGLAGADASRLTDEYEDMRLLDIKGDMRRHPNRSDAARLIWIQKNFHVSEADALRLNNLAENA